MADQSDVEQAIVQAVEAVLYPNGLAGDPPLSILGCPARIGRGWPDAVSLDQDLRAQILNVTVYQRQGQERNTSPFMPVWTQGPVNPTTFTLTQAGQVITVGGAQPATYYAQNLAILVGVSSYAYKVLANDTPATIAAALAALIPGATAAGAAITLTAGALVAALRVGATGTLQREVKRQVKWFQTVFWCFNPTIRDQACSAVDAALAGIEWLTLADGTRARLIYQSTFQNDAPEKEILYRRDLIHSVEWPTIQTETGTQIVSLGATVTEGPDVISPPVNSYNF